MYCGNCGVQMSDGARFCSGCGSSLGATASEPSAGVGSAIPGDVIPAAAPTAASGRRPGVLIAGVVALAVVGGIGGYAIKGQFTPAKPKVKTFSAASLDEQIKDSKGSFFRKVSCPADEPLTNGTTFVCIGTGVGSHTYNYGNFAINVSVQTDGQFVWQSSRP
jgi:hypothetical protein